MQITVRYFASLVDRTGCASEELQVASELDVAGLWQMLLERHKALADLAYRPMVACDLQYAEWTRSLDGIREVAFLPPVSGG